MVKQKMYLLSVSVPFCSLVDPTNRVSCHTQETRLLSTKSTSFRLEYRRLRDNPEDSFLTKHLTYIGEPIPALTTLAHPAPRLLDPRVALPENLYER